MANVSANSSNSRISSGVNDELRRRTEEAVERLHRLIRDGEVPPPVLHPKCKHCSLHAVCMPELITAQTGYRRAAEELFMTNA